MGIKKTAIDKNNFRRSLSYHQGARYALGIIIDRLIKQGVDELLLPAYIGYSSREGSGIFDPVSNSGIRHTYYKMDRHLQIEMESLKEHFNTGKKIAVLLVHYFGVPDVNYSSIISFCKSKDAIIIEDAAHALYTEYVDHACGFGDFSVFSIHKMLPFDLGGMLRCRGDRHIESSFNELKVFDFDFHEISEARKRNAREWNRLILSSPLCPDIIEPLFSFREDVTYQTFPIIIKNSKRDDLYFGLNDQGYGAVSLYHQMIFEITEKEFADSHWLANHILNLPVHQDIRDGEIERMFEILTKILFQEV